VGETPEELRVRAEVQRAELSRDLEAIGDRISPGRMLERRRASIRQRVHRAREAVMGTADSTTDQVRSGVEQARARVGEAVAGTGDRISDTPDAIRRRTEGNPLAAGLIAFGAGLLVASVIPSSKREERAARRIQPQLAQVADEVRGSVKEVADELRPAAQEAVHEVKESAKEAAESVKENASDRAAHVADEATQATPGPAQQQPSGITYTPPPPTS
jgi:gas vesicle protein